MKQETHDAIKLLAQIKFDSIADIISQARQAGYIPSLEFQKVLQKLEKYHKAKTDIRNQSKAKIKQITKEQQDELFEQGRKKCKEDFLRGITNSSDIQGVNTI